MKMWYNLGKSTIIATIWFQTQPVMAQYVLLPGEPIPERLLDPKVQKEMMTKPFDWELFKLELKRAEEREKALNEKSLDTKDVNKPVKEASPVWQRPDSEKPKPSTTIFKKN